jgi:hypothetical protein
MLMALSSAPAESKFLSVTCSTLAHGFLYGSLMPVEGLAAGSMAGD